MSAAKAVEGIEEPQHLNGAYFPPLPERQLELSSRKPNVRNVRNVPEISHCETKPNFEHGQ